MTTLAQLPSLAKYSEYRPENLGWSARDPEKDGSLLVPFAHSGVSFGSMHRDVVTIFTALLDELVPLIPGGLVKGTCGCYNPKSVTGSGKRSFHTYAIAIDVNWSANPMNVPLRTGPHTMPKAAAALARKYGCVWGGTWTDPIDCMHLEVHLTPAQARAFQPPQEDSIMAKLDDDDRAWLLKNLGPEAIWFKKSTVVGVPDGAKPDTTVTNQSFLLNAWRYSKAAASAHIDYTALAAAFKAAGIAAPTQAQLDAAVKAALDGATIQVGA